MKEKLIQFIMSYQGYMIYRLLNRPRLWSLSDDLSKSHIIYLDSPLGLRVGYGFSRFDISDQDSIKELTFMDKLILWPKARKVRDKLTHSYIEELL